MIRPCLIRAFAIGLALLAVLAGPAAGAVKERTCFYYANSGWGMWATRNVSCKTARKVYNDATKRIPAAAFDQTISVDGYRCKMNFDGGGAGRCTAPRDRRIRFDVP